ncbi:Xaa-Pro dipeptidase [Caldalkalibacillus uzonensis]|uniref:Xaa-Pro dipeptidase n=1 Tax=Caldalkalibacillus uzonensis TaxID=353224 RepID=A0ABU0CWX1_9BACI|nr:M24 family metallopeptidase [Caldalkalibacillus uzonensis]MDQ0339542.1 Xaa-Pro dipeptidase [Caldalkalibacillus uzonensis]
MLPFEISEYKERLGKTKQTMEAAGIEVLLITDPANMNYLSGYDAWSFYVHQMLVVMTDEPQPVWIGRKQDANGAKLTTWLDAHDIIPYPDDYVQSPIKHPMDFVADILKEMGQAKRHIGVEMDSYYFTAKCFERLQAALPNSVFKDATLLVNRVRLVKSDAEIMYMKRASKLAEKAMAAAIEAINDGVRECEVAASIYQAQISGTEEFGGDYPSIVPLMPSGNKTCTPHLTWTDSRYTNGDLVIVELAGCYKRYHCPMARTAVIGHPAPQVKEVADIVIEGLNVTLEAIQPGMTCEEVEQVWKRYLSDKKLEKDSRLGYSMGLNYPPDWGEHTASLRQGDLTVLEPNMTFHLIPGIWLDDFGVEISESFRVTEKGYEVLADFPRQLFVKPVLKAM